MKNKIVALCSIMLLVLVFGMVAQAQDAKVAGTWTMTNQGRNGVVTSTLTLTQDGAKLAGSMKGEAGPEIKLDSGTVAGKNVTFTVTRQGRNGDVKVEYKGTVDGDTWTWLSDEHMGGMAMKGRFTMKVLSPTSYNMKFELSQDGTNWTTAMEGKATKK